MTDPLSLLAALIFALVFSACMAAGLLWARWSRRQERAQALQQLERLVKSSSAEPIEKEPGLVRFGPDSSEGWEGRLLERLPGLQRVARLAEQGAVPWSVRLFLLQSAGFGMLLCTIILALSGSWILAVIALGVGSLLPYIRLRRAKAKRIARFEEPFPAAVDLLSRAIRAGHPLSAGLKMVAEEAPEPISDEFRRVFDEQKFGLSMQESLDGLVERIDLPDVRIFATAVVIQREVGGNLAEILDQIAETIRERFKIVRQVRTFTAQGRMTGLLLGALPIGLGLLLMIVNPDYMLLLIQDPAGRVMLGSAATLQLIGFGIIHRITAIEV